MNRAIPTMAPAAAVVATGELLVAQTVWSVKLSAELHLVLQTSSKSCKPVDRNTMKRNKSF
jgi:hypothetical protein